MDDTSRPNQPATSRPAQLSAKALELMRQYPTAMDLRARARKRMPKFAFEYMDGGAGNDGNIARNWNALDSVELIPRYGRVIEPPPCNATIFGREYAAPIGMSPIGGPSTAFPGAETFMAIAAQKARVPYVQGVLTGIELEKAAELAPDVHWLQLYRFHRDNHRIGLDLCARAEAAGTHVMMLTIDTPIRTVRSREVKSGIVNPFRLTNKLRMDAMTSPAWMAAMARNGVPRFASLSRYMKPGVGLAEAAAFIREHQGGAFTWDEIALYRDKWKKPMVLKGVLHPEDAEKALALGIDGLFVTNHGGRQIESLPASADVLPAIAEQVKGRASIFFDSGVRSGVDVARVIALGADAAFAGKSYLWSLGALGPGGPEHLTNVYMDELRATLGQLGCHGVDELRGVKFRHPGAFKVADFEN